MCPTVQDSLHRFGRWRTHTLVDRGKLVLGLMSTLVSRAEIDILRVSSLQSATIEVVLGYVTYCPVGARSTLFLSAPSSRFDILRPVS